MPLEFSVIYSIDCPRDTSIVQFNPPSKQKRLWQMTEGDSQYGYGYLEGCWTQGRHRKWCTILSREQFEEFLSRCDLHAEDVQTMGSLGAPGCGYGLSMAFSFSGAAPEAILNAYVTLMCEPDELVVFLQAVKGEKAQADFVVPTVRDAKEGLPFLFDGGEDEDGKQLEKTIRKALCVLWK